LLERDLICGDAEGCGEGEENEFSYHDARREKGVVVPPSYPLNQCGPFSYMYESVILGARGGKADPWHSVAER
jgi:hypothetical protein